MGNVEGDILTRLSLVLSHSLVDHRLAVVSHARALQLPHQHSSTVLYRVQQAFFLLASLRSLIVLQSTGSGIVIQGLSRYSHPNTPLTPTRTPTRTPTPTPILLLSVLVRAPSKRRKCKNKRKEREKKRKRKTSGSCPSIPSHLSHPLRERENERARKRVQLALRLRMYRYSTST